MIVDVKCAQAILRGADIFTPGVIGMSFGNFKVVQNIIYYIKYKKKE